MSGAIAQAIDALVEHTIQRAVERGFNELSQKIATIETNINAQFAELKGQMVAFGEQLESHEPEQFRWPIGLLPRILAHPANAHVLNDVGNNWQRPADVANLFADLLTKVGTSSTDAAPFTGSSEEGSVSRDEPDDLANSETAGESPAGEPTTVNGGEASSSSLSSASPASAPSPYVIPNGTAAGGRKDYGTAESSGTARRKDYGTADGPGTGMGHGTYQTLAAKKEYGSTSEASNSGPDAKAEYESTSSTEMKKEDTGPTFAHPVYPPSGTQPDRNVRILEAQQSQLIINETSIVQHEQQVSPYFSKEVDAQSAAYRVHPTIELSEYAHAELLDDVLASGESMMREKSTSEMVSPGSIPNGSQTGENNSTFGESPPVRDVRKRKARLVFDPSEDAPRPKNATSDPAMPRPQKPLAKKENISREKVKCEHCEMRFYPKDLARHLVKHTGERPYKCMECIATYPRVGALQKHQKAHAPRGTTEFECVECNCNFSTNRGVLWHMAHAHNGQTEEVVIEKRGPSLEPEDLLEF